MALATTFGCLTYLMLVQTSITQDIRDIEKYIGTKDIYDFVHQDWYEEIMRVREFSSKGDPTLDEELIRYFYKYDEKKKLCKRRW